MIDTLQEKTVQAKTTNKNNYFLDVGSMASEGMTISKADEATEEDWIIFIHASNEKIDAEGEVVMQKALEERREDFLTEGMVTYHHKHCLPMGIRYIIGEPLDVDFRKDGTFIKARLYQKSDVAQSLWKILQSGSTKVKASIGGREDFSKNEVREGKFVKVISKMKKWNEIALTFAPNNETLMPTQTTPFKVFQKAIKFEGDEMILSKELNEAESNDVIKSASEEEVIKEMEDNACACREETDESPEVKKALDVGSGQGLGSTGGRSFTPESLQGVVLSTIQRVKDGELTSTKEMNKFLAERGMTLENVRPYVERIIGKMEMSKAMVKEKFTLESEANDIEKSGKHESQAKKAHVHLDDVDGEDLKARFKKSRLGKALGKIIRKARAKKYIKREGSKGKYKYFYAEGHFQPASSKEIHGRLKEKHKKFAEQAYSAGDKQRESYNDLAQFYHGAMETGDKKEAESHKNKAIRDHGEKPDKKEAPSVDGKFSGVKPYSGKDYEKLKEEFNYTGEKGADRLNAFVLDLKEDVRNINAGKLTVNEDRMSQLASYDKIMLEQGYKDGLFGGLKPSSEKHEITPSAKKLHNIIKEVGDTGKKYDVTESDGDFYARPKNLSKHPILIGRNFKEAKKYLEERKRNYEKVNRIKKAKSHIDLDEVDASEGLKSTKKSIMKKKMRQYMKSKKAGYTKVNGMNKSDGY